MQQTQATKAGSLYGLTSDIGGLGAALQPPQPAKFETQSETLRIDPSEGEPLDPWESVVSVGDRVESLLEGESLDPATTTLFR